MPTSVQPTSVQYLSGRTILGGYCSQMPILLREHRYHSEAQQGQRSDRRSNVNIVCRCVSLLLLLCLIVLRSEASAGPLVFSTETNLGGGFFTETFTISNLQPTSNSGFNLLKVR